MKKQQMQTETAAIGWVVHSNGDTPAAGKLSVFVRHSWTRWWPHYMHSNKEEG